MFSVFELSPVPPLMPEAVESVTMGNILKPLLSGKSGKEVK